MSFAAHERDALYRIIGARRNIRAFRAGPVLDAVLRRGAEVAHQAPSVGLMQPWSFIIVTAMALRQQVAPRSSARVAAEAARLDPVRGLRCIGG